ncbi:hypothetical protein SNEBB_009886 [Seison nebaliae]|nr:hypothetical protein SNEBB_009886 [Seison nebaliae]
MIYGCLIPGNENRRQWKCDEAAEYPICGELTENEGKVENIIYAWAMNATHKILPKHVSFRIGKNTNIKYLVIQLHYKTPSKNDHSGIILHTTGKKTKYQLGYYVLATVGFIPPKIKNFHMESGCVLSNEINMYPIAYRVHAHSLGRVNSGYVIKEVNGTRIWYEIGRNSPQQPQMFYESTLPNNFKISQNDVLASRCTMNSMKRNRYTNIGAKHSDEMCNFYIMYYTDFEGMLNVQFCIQDHNTFHWNSMFKNDELPALASTLKGVPILYEKSNEI